MCPLFWIAPQCHSSSRHIFTFISLTCYCCWLCVPGAHGLGSDDEVRLVEYLFAHKGYNELIRPVANLSDTVNVDLGLAMIQLIHVEEKNQIMKSNVWLRMAWNDYQLKWDTSYFGGIRVIRISPQKIWKPDIVLFNNADGKYEVSWQPNILIYNTGSIIWIPPSIYKSSCTIDVEFFPFDQQKCEMKFGSWTFDAAQVSLGWYGRKENVDLSDYWKSGTWDIIACPGTIKNESRPGQPRQTQIIYTIRLRRKTLFYTVNLIIPCVLISFLSVCVFYLPADAGEKMTLCISILLALVVFLLLVSKILPPTSISIPLISKFLLFTFIMNIFTIMITVIIINWNFRTPRTHKMARWVKVVFMQYLPLILFMKRPDHIVEEERRRRRMRMMRTTGGCNGGLRRTGKTSDTGAGSPTAPDGRRGDGRGSPASQSLVHSPNRAPGGATAPSSTATLRRYPPPPPPSLMLRLDGGDDTPPYPPPPFSSVYSSAVHIAPSAGVVEMRELSGVHVHGIDNAQVEMDVEEEAQRLFFAPRQPPASQQQQQQHHPNCRLSHRPSPPQGPARRRLLSDDDDLCETATVLSASAGGKTDAGSAPSRCSEGRRGTGERERGGGGDGGGSSSGDGRGGRDSNSLPKFNGVTITPELKRAINAINFISSHLQIEDEYSRVLQDWKYVASVIDRVQLVIFVTVTIVGTIGILMNAPYILEYVDQDAIIKKFSS